MQRRTEGLTVLGAIVHKWMPCLHRAAGQTCGLQQSNALRVLSALRCEADTSANPCSPTGSPAVLRCDLSIAVVGW